MSEHHEDDSNKRSRTGRSLNKKSRLQDTLRLIRERESGYSTAANQESENRQPGRTNTPKPDPDLNNPLRLLTQLEADVSDVIADIPNNVDIFHFEVTDGEPPRFWIDQTTFVVMAKNNEGFRMLKDTRVGRILLRESENREAVANAIVQYVAERVAQHQANETTAQVTEPKPMLRDMAQRPPQKPANQQTKRKPMLIKDRPTVVIRHSRFRSFIWFIIGTLFGAISLLATAWFRQDIIALLKSFIANSG